MPLFLLPLLLFLSSLRGERIYIDTPVTLRSGETSVWLDSLPLANVRAEARMAMKDVAERQGMARSWWSLSLRSPADTLTVSLRHGNTDYGDMLDRRFSRITATLNGHELWSGEAEGFAARSGGYNTLSAELDTHSGALVLRGGAKLNEVIAEIDLGTTAFSPCEASVASHGGEGTLSLLCVEKTARPSASLATEWDAETVASYLKDGATAPLEGYWTYFDRQNDPIYARPGGRYRLAVVADGEGGYDILYVDGAQTLADRWSPFMLKGHLRPTVFAGHFDLQWVDSEFRPILHDIHATVDETGTLLTLSFPLLRTTLRFSKEQAK